MQLYDTLNNHKGSERCTDASDHSKKHACTAQRGPFTYRRLQEALQALRMDQPVEVKAVMQLQPHRHCDIFVDHIRS